MPLDRQGVEPDLLRPWWRDLTEVRLLLAWLVENCRIRTLDEALYYLEKPKKWNLEREDMLREGELDRIAEEHAALEDEAWDDMQRRSAL